MKKLTALLLVFSMVIALSAVLSACSTQEETQDETTAAPITVKTQVDANDPAQKLAYIINSINSIKADKPFAIQREAENYLSDMKLSKGEDDAGIASDFLDIYYDLYRQDIKENEYITVYDFDDIYNNPTIGRDNDEDIAVFDKAIKENYFARSGDIDIIDTKLSVDDIDSVALVDGADIKARAEDPNIPAEEKHIEGYFYNAGDENSRMCRIVLKPVENPTTTENTAVGYVFDVNPNTHKKISEEISKFNNTFSFGGYNTLYNIRIECRIDKATDRVTTFSIFKDVVVTSNEDGVRFSEKLPELAQLGKLDFSVSYGENFTYNITWEDPAEAYN